MSGFICPDCSGTYFTHIGKQLQCELCGWIGENDRSRKWLTEESIEHNAKRHAAIKSGKLFVFRIHCKGPDKDRSDAIDKTIELLGISGMGGTDGRDETKYLAELDHKPTEETLAKIRKLKTVQKVSVWP
ncbi:hypothetical protein C4580_00180 [Candidatus Woesearchaeota archaeon]|nr:MAG: hypothetical protein C4580_00180 [Candidatus Woesearchaeota archaeon]